ncbi:MAG: DNA replication/repair protein RecF [Rhodospirillales bacterium]|nr:DNA replication/repair protein RecF [Rhodospirillales bacterium]USO08286.1 MAG: DNA replication/repair protein RecF [Rhodospirillales bacterium]
MSAVLSLQLHGFRNYRDTLLGDLGAGFVVLTGANGAGKTNVLEAVSLLSPGRGLRGARVGEMRNRSLPDGVPWSVAASVDTPVGIVKIGTGLKPATGEAKAERRAVRVNGVDLKAQADLSEYVSCVWLTPQMDGLFLGPASERRRFFDRLVYAFDAAHAGRVTRYENVLSQRARLLRAQAEDGVAADPAWLSSLEAQMAETGVAIAAARAHTLESLIVRGEGILAGTGFPAARLTLAGGVEDMLAHMPALEVEDRMRARLERARGADAQTGGASVGPHRTDLQVVFAAKDMPAAQCSTGEQKALLTGIVLAHAMRTKTLRDAAPILLLDEIAAHFDAVRRDALFGILHDLRAQVFLTGTDAHLFSGLSDARYLGIHADSVREAA